MPRQKHASITINAVEVAGLRKTGKVFRVKRLTPRNYRNKETGKIKKC